MTSTFKIDDTSDSNPANWNAVSTLLSSVSGDITADRALEWEYQPYSSSKELDNGYRRGLGFPVVTWKFRALRPEQRENLKDFCSTLAADVYIQTPTNETTSGARVWKNYRAIMKWTDSFELVGVDYVEEVVLTFTHCIEVT